MRSSYRVALAVLAAAVLAGCSGGAGSVVPSSSLSSGGAGQSTSLSGAQSKSTSMSAMEGHHQKHDNDDFHIVALLKLDVDNGNATFHADDEWKCHFGDDSHHDRGGDSRNRGDGRHHDDDDGWVYRPHTDESFPIPAFSLENRCHRHHDDEDSHHDRDGGDANGNYYVAEVTLPDYQITAIDGPAAISGDDLAFPAANVPLSLKANVDYAFVLVRAPGTLPTPTPVPTATPIPPGCHSFAGTTGAAPLLKSTPTPVQTNAPSGFVSYVPLPNGAEPGDLTCGPQLKVYGTMSKPGFFTLDPASNAAATFAAGTRFASHMIAAGGDNEIYLDPGVAKTATVVRVNPDGTGSTSLSLSSSIGGNITGLATGGDGNVYAAGQGDAGLTIFQVQPSGTDTQFAAPAACTQFSRLQADATGSILALDTVGCGLAEMTTAGVFAVRTSSPVGDAVAHVAPGPDNAVYYGSRTQGAIVRIDAGGAARPYTMPAEANDVQDVIAGPDGNLWFSADHYDGSVRSGGVIGRMNLKTGQITEIATTVAGTNDPVLGALNSNTNPMRLTLGPDHNIYGSTNTAQDNVIKIVPSLLP